MNHLALPQSTRPRRGPLFTGNARRHWSSPSGLILVIASLLGALLLGEGAGAQDKRGAVYVVPITGEIDLGLAPYLDRVLGEAADAGAAAVLFEIDTPGGRLDAVLQ